jgi:N-acyl homoserine lactone hydrolase
MDDHATPARLYLFEAAQSSMPGPGGPIEGVAGSYLVTMSDGSHVLVDSGPPADMGHGSPSEAGVVTATEQLSRLGIRPEDVAMVVTTHFDIDHAGQNDAFPNAVHVVQKEHLDVAKAGYERFARHRAHWDIGDEKFRTVEGDTELFPGFELIATPGHVPAHQSVLLTLPNTGPVLLTADAVPLAPLFRPDRPKTPVDSGEEDELRASTQKLLRIRDEKGVKLVIHHHDGAQWKTLKRAPDYYD